jgi:hypothetical protein
MAQSNFSAVISPIATNIGGNLVGGVYVGNSPDGYLQWVEPNDNNVSWATTTFGIGTFVVQPFAVPHFAAVSATDVFVSNTYSATNGGSSQNQSLTVSLGIYSLNVSTLSLISSFSQSTLASVTGSTSSVSFQGLKNWPITTNAAILMSPGNYWVALGSSTSSAGHAIAAGLSNGIYSFAGSQSLYKGPYGSSTAASQCYRLGAGILSVSSASVPVSIALSDISNLAGNTGIPIVNFKNYSA